MAESGASHDGLVAEDDAGTAGGPHPAGAGYEDLIAEALAKPFVGWDFSWLRRRAPIATPLPWNYAETVAALAPGAHRMLDMGTGGGEVLSRLRCRASGTIADETWPPNVPIAAARLAPFGIPVVQDEGAPDNDDQDGVRDAFPIGTARSTW